MNKKIKELPEDMRPYEKCQKFGPENLTDTELLAIMLRSGTKKLNSIEVAEKLLNNGYHTGLSGIIKYSLPELRRIEGIGEIKGIQLLCIGEIASRIISEKNNLHRDTLTKVEDLYYFYSDVFSFCEQEEFHVLSLDTKYNIIHDSSVFRGSVNETLASPREIFLEALKYHAVNICVAHNHPSGDVTPSDYDINITKRLQECGMLLGIHLLDHMIIGDNNYYSFKEMGMLE